MNSLEKSSQSQRRVLVGDPDPELRHRLQAFLAGEGFDVVSAVDGAGILRELASRSFDFAILALEVPELEPLTLVERAARLANPPIVIGLAAAGATASVLEAIRRGAYDALTRPFRPEDVLLLIRKAEERERQRSASARTASRARMPEEPGFCGIIGAAPSMQAMFETIQKVAEYKTNVLVTGESGTGKELVARAIHDLSPRRGGAFVAVNCGAIPETLLESELFGHRKGAFTDASRDKRGLFEEAHGGTLLLDEIGEMPLGLQVKLLRAIQEEEIRPLGDNREVQVDVRVVAATTRTLSEEVKAGRFREDLFYRLNVLPVHLPPLRDRREDIPVLVEHFIRRNQRKHAHVGMRVEGVTPEAMQLLLAYHWPGNVRELENTIERAMVLCDGTHITAALLGDRVRGQAPPPVFAPGSAAELSIKKTMRAMEERLIRKALEQTGGNRTNAAKILEISHRALLYKIKEYGITA